MVILVTCKNEEDLFKNEDARVLTTLNIDFFNHSRAANSAVKGRIWLKFKLIQDVMVILVTSKNEEDLIKNEGARMLTTLSMDFSNTQGQLTPQSKDESGRKSNSSEILWLSSLPARMKKIRTKYEASRVLTTFSPL